MVSQASASSVFTVKLTRLLKEWLGKCNNKSKRNDAQMASKQVIALMWAIKVKVLKWKGKKILWRRHWSCWTVRSLPTKSVIVKTLNLVKLHFDLLHFDISVGSNGMKLIWLIHYAFWFVSWLESRWIKHPVLSHAPSIPVVSCQ